MPRPQARSWWTETIDSLAASLETDPSSGLPAAESAARLQLLSTEPLSAVDLAVVLVVSTALFWVVELQKLVRRWRPGAGSRLMTDARSQNAADRLQPDTGVAR